MDVTEKLEGKVGEFKGNRHSDAVHLVDTHEGEELEASPDEEQAEAVGTLPSPLQPTHSEYCDHCVTHYPFRASALRRRARKRIWALEVPPR